MPDAIGSALANAGNWVGTGTMAMPSIGNAISGVGNWLSPAAGMPGSSVAAGITPTPTGAPGAFPAPGAVMPVTDPGGNAMPSAAPASIPAQVGNLAATNLFPGATAMANAPGSTIPIPATAPSAPITTPSGFGASAADAVSSIFSPQGWHGINAMDLAKAWDTYQKYQMQSQMRDPNWLASQASNLFHPLSKALKAKTAREVMATAAEGGYAQAPGMVRTATAEALAPYEEAQRTAALQQYLSALQLAQNENPMGDYTGMSNFLEQAMLQEQQRQALLAQQQAGA